MQEFVKCYFIYLSSNYNLSFLGYRYYTLKLSFSGDWLFSYLVKFSFLYYKPEFFHRRGTDVGIMVTAGITQKDTTLSQKRGKLTRGYVPRNALWTSDDLVTPFPSLTLLVKGSTKNIFFVFKILRILLLSITSRVLWHPSQFTTFLSMHERQFTTTRRKITNLNVFCNHHPILENDLL